MKKILIWLERPKIIVPAVLIVAIIVGFIVYHFIGRTPVVILPDVSNNQIVSSIGSDQNSINLAFPKAGRLAEVSVQVGDIVKKGDILVSLDAVDALGAVNQTKGALELAKAQYASLNVQYANAKNQQDVLVENAYRTLLTSNLMAVAEKADYDKSYMPIDNGQVLQITGAYTCDKEGSYKIKPYASGATSGYSFTFSGLEEGIGNLTNYTAQPFGKCGLFIQFPVGYSGTDINWIINIPNNKSSTYTTNKNAYDLAVATRDQVLNQLEANLGKGNSMDANIAQASINVAEGAYEVAQANYQNDFIVAPTDGAVTFVDSNLKVGQVVAANKILITILKK